MIKSERRLGDPTKESRKPTACERFGQVWRTLRILGVVENPRTRTNLIQQAVVFGVQTLQADGKEKLITSFRELLEEDPVTASLAYNALQAAQHTLIPHTNNSTSQVKSLLGLPTKGPAFPAQQPKQG